MATIPVPEGLGPTPWIDYLQHADWGAAVVSPRGELLAVNPAFARMHGYRAEELPGRPFDALCEPTRRAELPALFATVDHEGHHRYESEHVRRDGRVFPVSVAAHVITGERGELQARAFRVEPEVAWHLGDDDGEYARAGRRLLQKVVDQLPVGVWITDASGTIVLGNPAGQRIWGGARFVGPEQYGTYQGWWLDTGERIAAEEWAAARAVQRGETSVGELVRIRAFDGTSKTIINSAVPLTDEQGRVRGAIVVNEDDPMPRIVCSTFTEAAEVDLAAAFFALVFRAAVDPPVLVVFFDCFLVCALEERALATSGLQSTAEVGGNALID